LLIFGCRLFGVEDWWHGLSSAGIVEERIGLLRLGILWRRRGILGILHGWLHHLRAIYWGRRLMLLMLLMLMRLVLMRLVRLMRVLLMLV
jgi:hypothetical protein